MFLGPLPGWRWCGILVKGGPWNQTGLDLNIALPGGRRMTLG